MMMIRVCRMLVNEDETGLTNIESARNETKNGAKRSPRGHGGKVG